MLRSVAAKTVRDAGRGLVWWTLGIVGLVLLTTSIYPSVEGNADFERAIESYPDALKAFFGGQFDLTSGPGFLDAELFSFMVPLLLLVYAIAAGARAVAGEEEAGTLDLLLANPLSRERLVLEKLAATGLLLAVLSAVLFVSVAALSVAFGIDVSAGNVAAATGMAWLLALLHGALALAVGAGTGSRAAAVAVPAAVGVAGYLLSGLSDLVDVLDRWRVLSPFHWYADGEPLRHGLDAGAAAVLLLLTALLAAAAPLVFRRRDLAV